MNDPKPIKRHSRVRDTSLHAYVLAPDEDGDWVRYEDHRARVEGLEEDAKSWKSRFESESEEASHFAAKMAEALARVDELEAALGKAPWDWRVLNRGLIFLRHAIETRSMERIMRTFGGNTPEEWCGVADSLGGLIDDANELIAERDTARARVEEQERELDFQADTADFFEGLARRVSANLEAAARDGLPDGTDLPTFLSMTAAALASPYIPRAVRERIERARAAAFGEHPND